MARTESKRPTDAELEILRVVWNRESSTVREVFRDLSQHRGIGYTTVLKLMQIMAQKGLVERDESQRSHVYAPTCTRDTTQKGFVGELIERAFAGSTSKLVLSALSSKRASAEELASIREFLDQQTADEKGSRS